METTAYHFHCNDELGSMLKLKAGDDAGQVMWLNMNLTTEPRYGPSALPPPTARVPMLRCSKPRSTMCHELYASAPPHAVPHPNSNPPSGTATSTPHTLISWSKLQRR